MGTLVLFPASGERLSGCPEHDMTGSVPLATPVSLEMMALCRTVWCCGFATIQTSAPSVPMGSKRHSPETALKKVNFVIVS